MMQIDRVLDERVARAAGMNSEPLMPYSSRWGWGGPLIEHMKFDGMSIERTASGWSISMLGPFLQAEGPTLLSAFMRLFVVYKEKTDG